MARSTTTTAIVLHTYDVGEADRFCILLTRDGGKVPARAKGVRKPKSKMGGSLLPFTLVEVTLSSMSSGHLITSAQVKKQPPADLQANDHWHAQHISELLLCLLEDHEPVPNVMKLMEQFVTVWPEHVQSTLPFTVRLLGVLGLLPSPREGALKQALIETEATFIEACSGPEWIEPPDISDKSIYRLEQLCKKIIDQQTNRTRRVKDLVT